MIKHSANDMVSEQVDRLVTKCAQEKNIVSEAALYELKLAVEASPEDFIADEEEKAFAQYVNVIGKYQAGITKEIDSDADFFSSRMDLLNFLHNLKTQLLTAQVSILKHRESWRKSPTIILQQSSTTCLTCKKNLTPSLGQS